MSCVWSLQDLQNNGVSDSYLDSLYLKQASSHYYPKAYVVVLLTFHAGVPDSKPFRHKRNRFCIKRMFWSMFVDRIYYFLSVREGQKDLKKCSVTFT